MIQKGAKYKHYKGNLYEVLNVAKCSETLEDFVIYKCLYENSIAQIWARPVKMFLGSIEVGGKVVPRFEKINHPEV